MNDPNALWKDLVPYQLNLMLNSNQGLVSFRQTLTLSRQKNWINNWNFLDIWLMLGLVAFYENNKFPLKEMINQPIFWTSNIQYYDW